MISALNSDTLRQITFLNNQVIRDRNNIARGLGNRLFNLYDIKDSPETENAQFKTRKRSAGASEAGSLVRLGCIPVDNEMFKKTYNSEFADVAYQIDWMTRRLIVQPLIDPSNIARIILLYGPPFTGKTFLVRLICYQWNAYLMDQTKDFEYPKETFKGKELDNPRLPMVSLTIATPKNAYNDKDSTKNITKLFECANISALRSHPLAVAVLLFDDFHKYHDRPEFLIPFMKAIDPLNLEKYPRVRVIVAARQPWLLPEALLTKIPDQLFIDLPADSTAVQMVRFELKKQDIPDSDISDYLLATLTQYIGNSTFGECLLRSYGFSQDQLFEFYQQSRRRPSDTSPFPFGLNMKEIVDFVQLVVQKTRQWVSIDDKKPCFVKAEGFPKECLVLPNGLKLATDKTQVCPIPECTIKVTGAQVTDDKNPAIKNAIKIIEDRFIQTGHQAIVDYIQYVKWHLNPLTRYLPSLPVNLEELRKNCSG